MPNIVGELTLKSVGKDVIIWEKAKIVGQEYLEIGDSVIIDDFVFLNCGPVSKIGSFVHIGVGTAVCGGGEFIMEDFSGMSGGVRVYTGNEDYLGGCLTNPAVPEPYRKAQRSYVYIHKHAIIGAGAVILPGVTIGEGVAVAAGAVVTRDCLPWGIYGGTPAKRLKERPSSTILELEIKLRSSLYDQFGQYIPKDRR